tara:strand:+ start:144 stop:974 length:831 start_codon:yes stop_codon:yes gene_type:complete
MAQLQRDFLALIPNLTKENIQRFNSIHFIDAENMIGKQTFKSNFVKRYVNELNSFISQYLKIYNDENSLFIISAGRNFIASSFFQYKGLEKNNIYSIPSYGEDGADLVLVETLITYLFSNDLEKYEGKIYIASSDKKFANPIKEIQTFSNNFFLIISATGNTGKHMLNTANFIKVFGLPFPDNLIFFINNFAMITGANNEKNFFTISIKELDEFSQKVLISITCEDVDEKFYNKFIDEEFRNIYLLEGYIRRSFGLTVAIEFNDKDISKERLEATK